MNLDQGAWVALWTPTDSQGRLLVDALDSNLDFLSQYDIRGVVVGGSTGHFPFLDVATRNQVLHLVVKRLGADRVIVNISDINPKHVIELAQSAQQARIKAIMLLPPFYYQFTQTDIAQYFVTMANAAQRPLILYNYPECARNNIAPETIQTVAKTVSVAGIKQSGSDFDYHKVLVELGNSQGFTVFTGSDSKLLEALKMGVKGYIGGLSNVIPELILEVYKGHQGSQHESAKVAQDKILQCDGLVKQLFFPLNIAAFMEARQLMPGSIREIIAPSTQQKYAELVKALSLLLKKLGL